MSKFLIFFVLISCAGYKYRNKQNPFAQFGINSLSVPMFYNHSNYAQAESTFTKEVFQTLLEYKNLELKTGKNPADAVLIGIVESRDQLRESTRVSNFNSVENTFDEDIIGGDRTELRLPTQRTINLSLRIIVIKHPTREEIAFLSTKMGAQAQSSKIIFNEKIDLSGAQTLKSLKGSGIKVIGTQNRGLNRYTIDNLAKNAASNFKDMILYAF